MLVARPRHRLKTGCREDRRCRPYRPRLGLPVALSIEGWRTVALEPETNRLRQRMDRIHRMAEMARELLLKLREDTAQVKIDLD